MGKIAFIGAGSRGFAKQLMMDILTRPALAEGTVSLMDVSQEYVEITAALTAKMVSQLNLPTRIEATTDRRRALDGADYVISTIRPTGIDTRTESILIGEKYGVMQVVGGETGASAMECAIKYMPRLLEIVRDMEELCPNALFLHYSNPTPILSWALNKVTPIRSIGMCHSVQGTAEELARYIGAPHRRDWALGGRREPSGLVPPLRMERRGRLPSVAGEDGRSGNLRAGYRSL